MLFRSLQVFAETLHHRLVLSVWRPQLVGAAIQPQGPSLNDLLQDTAVWFAVPKKKVTRHKKRLKTTLQKRIKVRKDIIVDPRTGEVTLMHKLPKNWKDYLPEV